MMKNKYLLSVCYFDLLEKMLHCEAFGIFESAESADNYAINLINEIKNDLILKNEMLEFVINDFYEFEYNIKILE